jgi:ATP:corrinoid adenosyltransferase
MSTFNQAAILRLLSENFDGEIKELMIARSAEWSYRYSYDFVKGPWEPGEDAISKSTEYSYHYAHEVIKGRWEPGEDAISKSAWNSYYYARDVIEGRWEKGEAAMMEIPEVMYEYAKNVIKGQLPDAMHNKMVILGSFARSANKWVRDYCQAKKYMTKKKPKVAV